MQLFTVFFSFLCSWAQIFNAAQTPDGAYLLPLVTPHASKLGEHWLAALRDYALVSQPPEYDAQVPVRRSY
jgi:hypothetical protein